MKPGLGIFASTLLAVASVPLWAVHQTPQKALVKDSTTEAVEAYLATDPPPETGKLAGQNPLPGADVEAPQELQNPSLPAWAFTPPPPRRAAVAGAPRRAPDPTPLHVPGSSKEYTRQQTGNAYGPPDWFPDDHPPMPKPVSEGHRPLYAACGYCHLVNGFGRPENAGLAGLPAAYIEEQIADFKHNNRHNSVPHMASPLMISVANSAPDDEIKEAAEYFAKVKYTKWITVKETNTVPKVHSANRMWAPNENGAAEPIGNRIIEVPRDLQLVEIRDAAEPFLAYVPVGSILKGKRLVRSGGAGKTVACVTCHGQDLKGMGNIPSIAGRSPSYVGRQIYDFKTGARHGENSALMKAPVAKLTDRDIVDIIAYLTSLEP